METCQCLLAVCIIPDFVFHPSESEGADFNYQEVVCLPKSQALDCRIKRNLKISAVYEQQRRLLSLTSDDFCLPVQLVKLCISMIDAGKAYNAANRQFVSGIRELAQQSTTDEVIEVNENAASRRTSPP